MVCDAVGLWALNCFGHNHNETIFGGKSDPLRTGHGVVGRTDKLVGSSHTGARQQAACRKDECGEQRLENGKPGSHALTLAKCVACHFDSDQKLNAARGCSLRRQIIYVSHEQSTAQTVVDTDELPEFYNATGELIEINGGTYRLA